MISTDFYNRYFLLILCLLIQGCYPDSVNPITEKNESLNNDSELFGLWSKSDDQHTLNIHVGTSKNQNLKVIIVSQRKTGEIDASMVLSGHVSIVNGSKYINLQYLSINPGDDSHFMKFIGNGYLLFKYTIEDESRLIIHRIDQSYLKSISKIIKSKTAGKNTLNEKVVILEEPNEVLNFVKKHSEKLFEKKSVTYKKMEYLGSE